MGVLQTAQQTVSDIAGDVVDTAKTAVGASAKQAAKTPLDMLEQLLGGDGFRILRTAAPAVPNAIAAFLLYLRNLTGKIPHVYFGWSEGNPLSYLFKYVAFGEGDTAPITHEVLRRAEKNPEKRPTVHVGG